MEIPNHSPHLHPELTLQGHSPSGVSSWQLHRRTGLHPAGLNLLEIHLMKLLEFRNLVRTDRERWVNSWPFSYDTRSCSRRKHDLQQSMAEDVMNVIKFDWSWRCSAFSSKNHLIWMKHRHVTYSMGSKTSHFRTRPSTLPLPLARHRFAWCVILNRTQNFDPLSFWVSWLWRRFPFHSSISFRQTWGIYVWRCVVFGSEPSFWLPSGELT